MSFDSIFSFSFLDRKSLLNKYKLKKGWFFLFQLKRLTLISLIGTYNSEIKLVRSVGSKAKIIQFNKTDKMVLVVLPSKIKKFLSIFSIVSKYSIFSLYKKKLVNNYASFNRLLGKSSITRGVAMNPIDHPHGGNTKSIKLQKTP
jgi:ribosomal protein L2